MRAVLGFFLGVFAVLLIGPRAGDALAQANPTVTFINGTDGYVQQFHIMEDGSKNRHAEIAPGAVSRLVSKPDQTWIFEVSGQQIGKYVATSAPNQSYTIKGKYDPAEEAPRPAPRQSGKP